MTTPPGDMDPARLRASAFIRQGEERMRRRWFSALTRWLDRTRPQVVTDDGIQPQNVGQNRAYWGQLMESEVVPEAASLYQRVRNRILQRDEPVTDADAAQYLNEVGNRLVRLPDEVYSLVVREVERGIAEGEGIPDLTSRVQTVLTATGSEYWPNRARTVARTEVMASVNAGAFAGAVRDAEERGDPAPFKVWLSTDDLRVRPTHDNADGQRTLLLSPFDVGGAQLMFPGDPRGPAQEVINCFPGDVRVSSLSAVRRIFRRGYEGPMLRIQMGDGVELSATPNHPLLTEAGWKSAQTLQTGDKLCGTPGTPRVRGSEPDVQDAPATFHELYRAAVKAGVSGRIVGRAMDFHGDGFDREIEVVLTEHRLLREDDPEFCEGLSDQQFVRLENGQLPLTLLRSTDDCHRSADGTELGPQILAAGRVCRASVGQPLLRSGVGLADPHGLTTSPDRETQFGQSPDNDGSADPEVVCETLDGLSGGMALREIVKIDRYAFSGHVYNLETVGGWYIANDTASHNCRCTFLPVTLGETLDWTNRGDP